MKTKTFIFALLAVAFAACNNTTQQTENEGSDNIIVENTIQNTASQLIAITPDGIGDLVIGSTIPDTIPDFEIVPTTIVYEEDIEDLEFHVLKDGKLVLVLFLTYEDESDVPSDKIRSISVYSDQYVTPDQFHVGSNIQDILKKEDVKTYFDGKDFLVYDNGILYIVFPEDYDGKLPEVPFDIPVEVEQPTFKVDALVREIQITKL
jgi:hypothetical protein